MKTLILLGSGHGGVIKGKYQTAGKRYYGKHGDQEIKLAEGLFNRAVVNGLAALLHLTGIATHVINPENEDVSLRSKVVRVNSIARSQKCIYLEVHHNYFPDSRVKGAEFFTSLGDTAADPMAEEIGRLFHERYPTVPLRRNQINPKEYSKDANYRVLSSTICPAILTEWAFMSNYSDRLRIFDFQEQAEFYLDAIMQLFNKKLIS